MESPKFFIFDLEIEANLPIIQHQNMVFLEPNVLMVSLLHLQELWENKKKNLSKLLNMSMVSLHLLGFLQASLQEERILYKLIWNRNLSSVLKIFVFT